MSNWNEHGILDNLANDMDSLKSNGVQPGTVTGSETDRDMVKSTKMTITCPFCKFVDKNVDKFLGVVRVECDACKKLFVVHSTKSGKVVAFKPSDYNLHSARLDDADREQLEKDMIHNHEKPGNPVEKPVEEIEKLVEEIELPVPGIARRIVDWLKKKFFPPDPVKELDAMFAAWRAGEVAGKKTAEKSQTGIKRR